MTWVIGIGLALIAVFLAVSVVVKPTDIAVWLQGLGIVAILALVAIGERRKRHGWSLWSGVSRRAFTYWNVGLGAFFIVVGVVLGARESYILGALNLVSGLVILVLGLLALRVLPDRTIERDAGKGGPRPPL